MKKRIISVLLCAGLVASMLAGCGSKEEQGQGGDQRDQICVDRGQNAVLHAGD